MKIFTVADGIWPPLVKMAGVSAIYNLQEALSKKKIEVHIFTTIEEHTDPSWKQWFAEREKKENLHFHYLNLGFLKKLRKTHFYLSKLLSFFIVLILQYKYHFDIIHEYSSSPLLILKTGFYRLVFGVHTIHTLCTHSNSFESQSKFVTRTLLPDRVICTTHHMVRILKDTISLKDKVIYLPLGIILSRFKGDTDKSLIKRKFRLSPKSKIVLYVGLIDKRKGIFDLAKAVPLVVRENPNVIFLIVSFPLSGVFYDYVKNKKKLLKIVERNKTKEKFLFFEGIYNIPELTAIADVFVSPLSTMYGTLGYPLVLLEAIASGKAIVASDIDGINELIFHNENGLLFPQGNIKMLARNTNRLLLNEDLRNKLGQNAKKRIEELNIDNIAEELKRLYIDVERGKNNS